MSKERLIVILGPTAVGKTNLSLQLAAKLQTEIISGDSMLVYRGFDIGTAKPSAEERCGIKHHLIDILSPEENFSVSDFQQRAAQCITAVNAQGKIPVLAGGTGLYIKSLVEGYEFNRFAGDDEYRATLERLAGEKGKAYVHDMLAAVDPQTAARLHVNDFRRVVRALEVYHLGGEKISQKKAPQPDLLYDAYFVGLTRPRPELYERINKRVDLMLSAGLLTEVKSLLASGINREAQAMKGIGYKEPAAYLAGEMSYEEMTDLIKKSTRHFAKRQLTWYRKMPYIHWYDVSSHTEQELLEIIYADIAGFFAAKKK